MDIETKFVAAAVATTVFDLKVTLLQLIFLNPIETLDDPSFNMEYAQIVLTTS